ncbi:PIN domain-containing protein, partial [Acinetobacter sp. YH01022]
MKKILLLDIENLHKTEKDLLRYLSQYHSIYLVYAKSPVNFSLDGLVKISPYVMNGKLKVLKMPRVGKDAADFGLAFIAGQLSTQVSAKEFNFELMSNDHSMDYIADLLKIAQFDVTIIQEKPLVAPHIVQELKAEFNVDKMVYLYCENLQKQNFSKPAKLESLINSLKANLKVEEEVAKVVVEELKKKKVIKIDANKISYNVASILKVVKVFSA